eukprot:143681-Pelagomonas_calceolata.AAC.1
MSCLFYSPPRKIKAGPSGAASTSMRSTAYTSQGLHSSSDLTLISTGASVGTGGREAPPEAEAELIFDAEGRQAGANKQRWTPQEALKNMIVMTAPERAE